MKPLKKLKKRKVGRPSKYNPKFCQELVDFFDIEPYEDIKIPHYSKDGTKDKKGKSVVVWEDYKRMANKLPTLRDFAKKIKVHVSNIYEWLNENSSVFHSEFRDAFTQAKDIRKDFLIQNGLMGLYPPMSFKFVAVNLTDMRDKTEAKQGITDELAELIRELSPSKGMLPND